MAGLRCLWTGLGTFIGVSLLLAVVQFIGGIYDDTTYPPLGIMYE